MCKTLHSPNLLLRQPVQRIHQRIDLLVGSIDLALRKALEGEDAAEIKQLSDALQNAFNALSQQLNAQEQSGAAGGADDFPNYGGDGAAPNGSGPATEEEGDVVEGEFTEA